MGGGSGIGSLLGVLASGNAANQALQVAANQAQEQQALRNSYVNTLQGASYSILGSPSGYGGLNPMMMMLPLMGMLPMLMMLIVELMQQQGQGQMQYPGQDYPQLLNDSSPGSYPPPYASSNGGALSQQSKNGPITYTSHGGWKTVVNGPKVTITSPDGRHTITESGDPHESGAQGAESTWFSKDRVIQLPDGSIVEMKAGADNGAINRVNILDGNEEVNINAQNNTITNVDYNPSKTYWDESQLPMDNMAQLGYNSKGQFQLTREQQVLRLQAQLAQSQSTMQMENSLPRGWVASAKANYVGQAFKGSDGRNWVRLPNGQEIRTAYGMLVDPDGKVYTMGTIDSVSQVG